MIYSGQKFLVGLVLVVLCSIVYVILYAPTYYIPEKYKSKGIINMITPQYDHVSRNTEPESAGFQPALRDVKRHDSIEDDSTGGRATESNDRPWGNERTVKDPFVSTSLEFSPWIYKPENEKLKPPIIQKTLKYISVYAAEDVYGNNVPFGTSAFADCRYSMCAFIKDYSRADAVYFISRIYRAHHIQKMWYRPPHQRWVFKTADAVWHDFHLDNDTIRSAFNWTALYKPDSDIFRPMGMLELEPNPPEKNFGKIFRHKKKFAAWFVSHCNTWSRREEYVRRMRQLAPVDVYGHCGNLDCTKNHQECFPMLQEDYKFYLSFENAFCNSYVTEKFFKLYGELDIIPVVRGGLDYNHVLPKGTFINTADFKSPEDLTKYLIQLANDEHAYVRMLQEKNKWRKHTVSVHCELCEKLHTDTVEKHYEDIGEHIRGKPDECWPPQDLGVELAHADINDVINSTLSRGRPWSAEWWGVGSSSN